MTGAIFDLDGTLLDSMPVWNDFGKSFLELRGIVAPIGLGAPCAPLPAAAQRGGRWICLVQQRKKPLCLKMLFMQSGRLKRQGLYLFI